MQKREEVVSRVRELKEALVLTNSHVQQAICAASRTSLLWGRRPDTTKVYNLHDYAREVGCETCKTIPQLFKDAGYFTLGTGKVFHDGLASNFSDPVSHFPRVERDVSVR